MKIHFIGICGSAMGNVALMMRSKGHIVTGSDQNMYPPMSEILINEGVTLFEGFSEKNIVNPDLIVIG
ncbi:MAG: Mur ligase domain-containing protein, partial [Candidatus Kapaibacterium sp.]